MPDATAAAIFAGGCFWCLEAVFGGLRGVLKVEPGYTGGQIPSPSYEAVCTGRTGHAEAVRLTYDPGAVSYRDLLAVFFAAHDPTTRDRQGHDVGSQYRAAVFYLTPAQRDEAAAYVRELEAAKALPGPVVTEVLPAGEFYPAEAYHRDYYRRNPEQAYCRAVIAPKLDKVKREIGQKLR